MRARQLHLHVAAARPDSAASTHPSTHSQPANERGSFQRPRSRAPWLATALALAALAGVAGETLAQESHKRLTLQIHSIKCLDESGGKYWERIGGDEIVLSGVAVDHRGNARRISTLRAGYFKRDNSVKRFSPPRAFASFALTGADSFPRHLAAYLVLVERDENGGFGPFIDKLVQKVNAGEKPVGGPRGTAAPISTRELERILSAAAVGNPTVLKDVGETVWKKLGDDIFPPVLAERTIKSPTALFSRRSKTTAPQRGVVKAHGGKYEIVYSWSLSG